MFQKLKNIYETKYKLLMIFPVLLLVLALVQIGVQHAATGDFVNKGISLKGGSTITITATEGIDPHALEQELVQEFPASEITVRTITSAGKVVALAVDSDAQRNDEITPLIQLIEQKTGIQKGDYSLEIIGSSLGDAFFSQTIHALLVAFLLMGIVVFIYFRTFVPSIAVILSAFSDLVVTAAIFNVLGFKLSTAGIAAFLMLLGFSVDTDMVLSTRLLRRTEGSVMERIYGGTKTALTMLAAALGTVFITLIFVQSEVIKQIMVILLIGLLVDFVMTWIQNVGILRFYLERKKH